jgi:AraC-like DNA-binding protein
MKIAFRHLKNLFKSAGDFMIMGRISMDQYKLASTNYILDDFMRKNRPFLLHHYSLGELSQESGIGLSDLKQIMGFHKCSGFKEFMDNYRIDYCKNILFRLPPKILNLVDLTVICGFSDQKELCSAFKRLTGIGITKYIRKAQKEWLPKNFVEAGNG